MNGFNLVDEPWVPCIFPGQSRAQLLSLRDTFRRAHEVADLGDRSPLVTAALYRLLLAVLHRVYGPRDEEAWEELWNQGSFDERVERYLTEWRERFDLFHPTHPFYQVAGLEADLAAPVQVLSPDFSAGNNPVLFDHTVDERPLPLTPEEAARHLLAAQSFAIGGLITRRKGEPASAKAAHLVKAAVVLNIGSNLFETLLLNLVRYDGPAKEPFEFDSEHDLPAWEHDQPTRRDTRRPRGYLDLLTWQSRQVLLFRDEDGLVRKAVRLEGWRLPDDEPVESKETMVSYRMVPGPRKDEPGSWVPIGFSPDRALWRDAVRFVEASSTESKPPRVITWLRDLRAKGSLPERIAATTVAAFGMATDRSKIHLWRREALTLPLAYLEASDLVSRLRAGLELAERVGEAVRRAASDLARDVLVPADGVPIDPTRVRALADSFESLPVFWSSLDLDFRRFLLELPEDAAAASSAWARSLAEAARKAFALAENAVASDAVGLRAAARVRPRFEGHLRALLREWDPQQPADGNDVETGQEVPA